jgi:hypothetical protein
MAGSPAVLELQRQINRFRVKLGFPELPYTGIADGYTVLRLEQILKFYGVSGTGSITITAVKDDAAAQQLAAQATAQAAAAAQIAAQAKALADGPVAATTAEQLARYDASAKATAQAQVAANAAAQAQAQAQQPNFSRRVRELADSGGGDILPYQLVSYETLDAAAYIFNSRNAGISDAKIISTLQANKLAAQVWWNNKDKAPATDPSPWSWEAYRLTFKYVTGLGGDPIPYKVICYHRESADVCSETSIAAAFAYLDDPGGREFAFFPTLNGPNSTNRVLLQQQVDAVKSYVVNTTRAGKTPTQIIDYLRFAMAQQTGGNPSNGLFDFMLIERHVAEAFRQLDPNLWTASPPTVDQTKRTNGQPQPKRTNTILVVGLAVIAATAVIGGVVYVRRRRRRVDRELVAAPAAPAR